MGNRVFTNNASALLAATITNVETIIQVDAGFGALFPSPGASETARLRLVNAAGDLEIVELTSRTGDLLTVVRGQEGTAAIAWTLLVTRVELSLTAETMDSFIQRDGDNMTGDLAMGGNEVQDARLTGATVIDGGQAVGTALRGDEGDGTNEVLVPSGGGRATAGGSEIITQADNLMTLLPVGAIIMWYTGLGSLPTGWQICDGSSGSPDLRDVFVRGAGGSFALGATGGATTASGNTSSSGSHNHGGNTGSHSLTEAQMPAHKHLDGATVRYKPTDSFGQTPTDGHVVKNENIWEHHQFRSNGSSARFYGSTVGSGSGHSHSVSSAGAHTHSVASISIIPPFHAVYYVMKVS